MNKILAAVLLLVSSTSYSADMTMGIRRVVDGDTISSVIDLPCPLCLVSVRIIGIDTPESTHSAKCEKERLLGIAAKEFTKSLAGNAKTMLVRDIKWDKYGGRINGRVEINNVDIGYTLIKQGLARPYTGQGPKSNWCS